MTDATILGRLQRVDLRDIWTSESSQFTPWLAQAENLRLLAETIGLELELEAQERNVGPFRADILCKDVGTGNWVLIENQLERTDHSHLGQLLTYAAGLKAATLIWIAERFTDEHRAALDWFNEIAEGKFAFFGLEVELWRIGNSSVAPKFNVVSQPNDWSKTVAESAAKIESGELSETKQLQLSFWAAFADYLRQRRSPIRPTKPQPQHWMQLAIGKSGCALSAIASSYDPASESFSGAETRAEVVLSGATAQVYFDRLLSDRDRIEAEIGEPLVWHSPTNTKMRKVLIRQPADIWDQTSWPTQHAWLLEKLESLNRVVGERLRRFSGEPTRQPSPALEGTTVP